MHMARSGLGEDIIARTFKSTVYLLDTSLMNFFNNATRSFQHIMLTYCDCSCKMYAKLIYFPTNNIFATIVYQIMILRSYIKDFVSFRLLEASNK